MKKIKILDCTLRDGGQGLEDADKNNIPLKYYEEQEVKDLINLFTETNIDILELGSLETSDEPKKRFCAYKCIEEISEQIPIHNDSQMFVALFRDPDVDLTDIPLYRKGLVEGVRVILRYSELEKSIAFCYGLSKKGYKVFVQPMLTMRYTDKQLKYLVESANKMHAYALYFVDSYGYMTEKDVNRIFTFYDDYLEPEIAIGFHGHNNMDMAVANAITFLHKYNDSRSLIVDSCAQGIGQGAGNLQTEIIAHYLNENYEKNYDMVSILKICEQIETHNINGLWGYSLTKFIPARNKTAYKYAMALKNKYHYTIGEIDSLLSAMPEDLRHRYTEQNTVELIKRVKGSMS